MLRVDPRLLGSCSGELLGRRARVARELSQGCSGVARVSLEGIAWETLGSCSEVARELSQGCSGVDPRLFRSCSEELLGSCSGVAPVSCLGVTLQFPTTLNLFSGISSLVCFVAPINLFSGIKCRPPTSLACQRHLPARMATFRMFLGFSVGRPLGMFSR